MNKMEFLQNLELMLGELPPDKKENLLSHYEDIINAKLEQGMAEEEIVASLDSPKTLSQFHLTEHLIGTAEKRLTTFNLLRVIISTLQLGFSSLILLVGPILGIIGFVLTLTATSAIVIITGLALLFDPFTNLFGYFYKNLPGFFYENSTIWLGTFFLSIGLIALGFLFIIGTYILMRLIYLGLLKHLHFHLVSKQEPLNPVLPHINFKNFTVWLIMIIFMCFLLAVIFFILGES